MTAEDDEEIVQRDIICEAFEDDDIVDDFNKEKRNEIEKDKPKDINLSLPGWGAWGGDQHQTQHAKEETFYS
jgi:U3 small nucleolar RNA-associated protein 14